ncbi:MAG: hypothetical protein C5B59_14780 [Bacteroidetes bacterium]|nr:MAG: hypothetical protein C5B59_14780 [Bacteroidota bacterium]
MNLPEQGKTQGIEGHVFRISGNQMPSPDVKPRAPRGIQTTVYIFELTNLSQVEREGQSAFYRSISTKLIKTTKSDGSGFFKVKLPPGHYSLFTKKDSLFYANLFDGSNNIAPVQVTPGKMSRIDIRVDYDAVY